MKNTFKKISLVITTAIALSSVPVISAGAADTTLPANYESALKFYNTNGETAVSESGKNAILVIPCLNTDKYGYVFADEGEDYTADLAGTYYKKENVDGENGFSVYKISFSGDENVDVNLEFSDLKNSKKDVRGTDLKLCYDVLDNGKFEVSPVPTTLAQSEAFLKTNGSVKISGKTAITVFDGIFLRTSLTEVKPEAGASTDTKNPEKILESDYSRDSSVANMGWSKGDISPSVGGASVRVCTYNFDDYGTYSLHIRKTNTDTGKLNSIYKYSFSNVEGSDVKINSALVLESGDSTANGVIDIYDAIAIAKNMIDSLTFTDEQKELADYDGNGTIDLYDCIGVAKLILQKSKNK